MNSFYQIKEYDSFISDKEIAGYKTLPESIFHQLEDFILTNSSKDTDALELMGLSAKKGIGKVITAKNYVGIITLNDGITIEILPKIYSASVDDNFGTRTKRVLIDMLKTLREIPFKSLKNSFVNIEKMDIFEIFIRMFVNEVFFIVKRGLKCSYEAIAENTTFFKGKILFSKQVKLNRFHKERNYVEYDAFTANRPENKLLKATLIYLCKRTTSSKNRSDIKSLLGVFSNVEASADYKGDFAKYIALALLFPMETLFENYVAAILKKKLSRSDFTVSVQDRTYHLFNEPSKKFLMKPDIVVRRKSDGVSFVLDTKWKILDAGKVNYGIAQADMYQMFAYQKKYGAECVMLLYPEIEKRPLEDDIEFRSDDDVIVRVQFIDLFNVKNSITKIIQQFEVITV